MLPRPRFAVLVLASASFFSSACASSSNAEEPKTAAELAPAAPPPDAPQPEPAVPAEPPPAQKMASEILSVPDKAWVFSFEGSTRYERAKAECDQRFANDPGARARCITKARDAFTADAMEFTRDAAGNDVWVIYRTKNDKLIKVYSVPIAYGEQDGDSVQIKKVGPEQGKPLLFAGVPEFEVKLGGEYTLELSDQKHGVLAYDARLGFITTR